MISLAADLAHQGQVLIADKGYRSVALETALTNSGINLIRPALKSEQPRPGQQLLRPFRQIIESVNQTQEA